MVSRRTVSAMFISLIVLAGSLPAHAQEGSVTGVVRDASAAAVPGVTVTATNQATGAAKTAITSNDGTFTISGLAPGAYTLGASLLGFRRVSQKDVQVAAGGTARAEFTLEALLAEEITVTAMLREQELADVPFSIAAPTEEVLRARGVDGIEGVAANVGGFTVQSLGPGQSQVAMRGVSAGQVVRDQPGVKEQVGVYLDDSVVSLSLFTPDLDLFDVSRVEVLRGPQGTLFGSGSLSGTVRYITNPPEIGASKWFAEVGGYGISGGSPGGNAKVGFNAPLGDTAAARLVGYYNRIGGYIDSPGTTRTGGVVRPDPNTLVEDVNTGYRAGGRAAVRFSPNSKLIITPRLVYQTVQMDGWNRVDSYNILANPFTGTRPRVTFGDREQFAQLDETFTDDFVLGDVTLNYDFGRVALTSVTSYTYRDVLVIRDATALTASITGGTIGLGEPIYSLDAPLNDATTAKLITQEVRLSGSSDRFHWVGGGFYSHTKRDYGQSLPVIGFTRLSGIPTRGQLAPEDTLFFSDLHYKLDQMALFGEGTLAVNDKFDVTAGLRFYRFSEDKEQFFDGLFGNDNNGGPPVSQPGTTDANGLAPRLILSYKANENTNFNAQVSRGFRLGGINDPLNVPLCTAQDLATFSGLETWQDETAWDYEVGVKSAFPNNRGSVRVAAFYMDISDLQATVTAGSCSSRLIFNVPKAKSTGVEAELEFVPNRNFDIAFSGSLNDSKLASTVPPVAATGIEDGRRLPTVPKFHMAAAATYQWPLRPGSQAYVTGSFQHVGGSRFTQVGDPDLGAVNMLTFEQRGGRTIGAPLSQTTVAIDAELPSYSLVNLRVGLRREKWDVALYVNNLTDERALLAFDRERGTLARDFYLTNQPRTFGVTLRVNP